MADEVKRRSLVLDAGLDRLQAYLLVMAPGDELDVDRAAEISALGREICSQVLEALARAGLLTRLDNDVYIRCDSPVTT